MATAEFTQARSPSRRPSRRAAIAARAWERLQESDFAALRRVRCEFADGRLTLLGIVPSFHLKQMAQVLVRDVPGVAQIANRVEVDNAAADGRFKEAVEVERSAGRTQAAAAVGA